MMPSIIWSYDNIKRVYTLSIISMASYKDEHNILEMIFILIKA